ncbi:hypothetical protein [Bacillus sp. C30]|uniref:hypothetical protein n=1 Tax=Bacillus sp. C30 TaxID=1387733 RepID=UPI00349F4AF1
MKTWIKPIICAGILVSDAMSVSAMNVQASENQIEQKDAVGYQLYASIPLEKIGKRYYEGDLFLLQISPTIQNLLKGSANIDSDADGPVFIEIPRDIGVLSFNHILRGTIKIFIQIQEMEPSGYVLNVKAEFYNEKGELHKSTFYEQIYQKEDNGIGADPSNKLRNMLRLGG